MAFASQNLLLDMRINSFLCLSIKFSRDFIFFFDSILIIYSSLMPRIKILIASYLRVECWIRYTFVNSAINDSNWLADSMARWTTRKMLSIRFACTILSRRKYEVVIGNAFRVRKCTRYFSSGFQLVLAVFCIVCMLASARGEGGREKCVQELVRSLF